MRELDHLTKMFPQFYERVPFECGDGWFDILLDLSIKIEDHISQTKECNHTDWEFNVSQVKEKYGGLRFYVSSACDKIFDMISDAEDKSLETCEECGKPGRPTDRSFGSWVYTRCPECLEKLKKWREESFK